MDCLRLDRIRETRGVHCALSGDGAAPGVSTNGGLHPLWAPDRQGVAYRTGASPEELEQRALAQESRVMAVSIETKPAFKAGQPRLFFEGSILRERTPDRRDAGIEKQSF